MRSPSPKTKPMETAVRVVPYLPSWSILAALMILGMERVPSAIYRPIDGDWAKWNVEAILHFGNVFDLSPYSMLAGMGSMYFPNLPWLNPGALALALPLGDATKNIVSDVDLRGRAGGQHSRSGARDWIRLVYVDCRRAVLPLFIVSALRRSFSNL